MVADSKVVSADWRVTAPKVDDPPRIARWDRFVLREKGGSIYHHSAWLGAIARCYGFEPRLLALEDPTGHLEGVLPLFLVDSRVTGRRMVSLPYTNAAGPVCRPGVDCGPLLHAAVELSRAERCRYLEVRGQPGQEPVDLPEMQRHDYFGSHILRLDSDIQRVGRRFDRRARRGIAKAAKSGVRTHFATDLTGVREFHRLNLLTRRKHGVPPQPVTFFECLWAELRPVGGIEILLAECEGVTVAGIVLLAFKDTVVYAYGASDQAFLRYAPNHALFDAAIGWAAEHGYWHFDFGRTAPDNEGLMEFKRQWGGEFLQLPYYYWPARAGFVGESESSLKHRLFAAIWSRLPLAVTATVGPPLYRHLA